MKEKLAKLLKNIPQVNHAEAVVHGMDYVFDCAADYLIANGVTFALDKPRPRPKGWQPMGAKSFMEYCPTCKNDGSDLCGMCIMEVESRYEPKENFPQVVVSPFEDASNNKEMYFKCGMRHMKAMVLAMLQDILDQEDGLCLIDLSEVIKAVEDL